MEHNDQHEGNKPMPDQPAPADNVQLHIETVIPDAEKEAPATDEKETLPSAAAKKSTADNKTLSPDENDHTKAADDPDDEKQNHNFEEVKASHVPDARDEIETVGQ